MHVKMRHFCPRTLVARSIVSMMSAASCLPSVVLFACGARASRVKRARSVNELGLRSGRHTKLVDGCLRCFLIEAAPVQHQAHEGDERVVDLRIGLLLRLFVFEQRDLRALRSLNADESADFPLCFLRCATSERRRAAPACAEGQRCTSDSWYARRSSLHYHPLRPDSSTCTSSVLCVVRAQMPTDDPFPLFPSVRKPCHAARSAARCESPAPQCQRRTRCTRMLRFRPSQPSSNALAPVCHDRSQ